MEKAVAKILVSMMILATLMQVVVSFDYYEESIDSSLHYHEKPYPRPHDHAPPPQDLPVHHHAPSPQDHAGHHTNKHICVKKCEHKCHKHHLERKYHHHPPSPSPSPVAIPPRSYYLQPPSSNFPYDFEIVTVETTHVKYQQCRQKCVKKCLSHHHPDTFNIGYVMKGQKL